MLKMLEPKRRAGGAHGDESCNPKQIEESTSYKLNHLTELILMHLAEKYSTRCRRRHFVVGTTLHAPVLLFNTYDACKVRDAGCRPSWRGAQSRIKGGGKRARSAVEDFVLHPTGTPVTRAQEAMERHKGRLPVPGWEGQSPN